MKPIELLAVVGARPNFMKMAPVIGALGASGRFATRLVHTGQHYDQEMSDSFFRDLDMPAPDFHLNVGSGSHATQTARILERFEPIVLETRPEVVIVAGDVNSTLACTLVASKLGVPVAHIEAGLRSRDRTMPEEINRLVTDVLADLLFTTSRDADENLIREGIDPRKIFFVGNSMIDTLRRFEARAREDAAWRRHGLESGSYLLVTLHRPSNVDSPEGLTRIVRLLLESARRLPVLFTVHPRTKASLERMGRWQELEDTAALHLLPPLAYPEFLSLNLGARAVLTDSGGVQEETTALRVPCLTLRPNTERPVTVTEGTNLLVSDDVDRQLATLDQLLEGRLVPRGTVPEFWDGAAGGRIRDVLVRWFRPE